MGAYSDSMLETARAFAVTFKQLTTVQLEDTVNLIETTVLPNGSWEDDPLTTAAVLATLQSLLPDLAVAPKDIRVMLEDTSPVGTLVIKVQVHNLGYLPAGEFSVVFSKGDPVFGGGSIRNRRGRRVVRTNNHRDNFRNNSS